MFQVYFESMKNLLMKYTSSILKANFKYPSSYFKYTSSILQVFFNL